MAYWHFADGEPAPAFAPGSRFDWSHLMPAILFAVLVLASWLVRLLG